MKMKDAEITFIGFQETLKGDPLLLFNNEEGYTIAIKLSEFSLEKLREKLKEKEAENGIHS